VSGNEAGDSGDLFSGEGRKRGREGAAADRPATARSEPISSLPAFLSSEIRIVAALVLAAFLVRIALVPRMAVLQPDGAYYLWMAEDLARGDFAAGLAGLHHPLFPALVAIASRATGAGLEAAAHAVSLVLGSLAAAALYLAFREAATASAPARDPNTIQTGSDTSAPDLRGRFSALAGAALYVVHPYAVRAGADVMSEATYLFFLGAAVAASLRAARTHGTGAALASGVLGGLAYLARPEGLVLPLVAGALLAPGLLRAGSRRRAAVALLALVAGTLLAAGPYVLYLRAADGEWRLSRKKSLGHLAGVTPFREGASVARPGSADLRDLAALGAGAGDEDGSAAPGGAGGRLAGAARVTSGVARTLVDGLHPALALLAALAVLRARASGLATPGARRLALFAAGLVALLVALLSGPGYLHRRHAIPAACTLLFFAGAGAAWLGARLPGRRPGPAGGTAVVLAVLAALLLPKALSPRFAHRAPLREAGRLLGERHGGPGARVVGHGLAEVAYYAGGRELPMPGGSAADVLAHARRSGAGYIGIATRARGEGLPPARAESALAALDLEAVVAYEAESNGRRYRISIFRVSPAGPR